MKKYSVILIVLVIGLVAFQGLVGFNQKQELLTELVGEVIIGLDTEPTEFNPNTQEKISRVMEDIYQAKVEDIEKENLTANSLISSYLPNYSELNMVEIIVNMGFILGIIVCLLKIRKSYKLEEDECNESIEQNSKIAIIECITMVMLGGMLGYIVFRLFYYRLIYRFLCYWYFYIIGF